MKRKIYLTVEDQEILIHVPWRKVIEMVYPKTRSAGGVDLLNLTKRERQVFQSIRRGLTNKEIGNELNISERTVKFHVSGLLSKIPGLNSRFDLLRKFGEVQGEEVRVQ